MAECVPLKLHEVLATNNLAHIHQQALQGEQIVPFTSTKLHLVANQQPDQVYTSPFIMWGRYGVELRDALSGAPTAICSFNLEQIDGKPVATIGQTPQGLRPDRFAGPATKIDRTRLINMQYDEELLSNGTIHYCHIRSVAPFRVNMLKGLILHLRLNDISTIRVISSQNNHLKVGAGHISPERATKIIDMPAAVLGFQRGIDGNWWFN